MAEGGLSERARQRAAELANEADIRMTPPKAKPASITKERTVTSRPFSEYKRKPGERVGLNWRVTNNLGKRSIRHVLFDTNFWKSFVQARLVVAQGDPGCLSLFGSKAETHRLFAEHVTAEYFVKTEGRGRTVDEWKMRPEQSDNHWLDCLVGCAVAASNQGAVLFGTDAAPAVQRSRLKLSELQRRNR